jgi:hypothetical protein
MSARHQRGDAGSHDRKGHWNPCHFDGVWPKPPLAERIDCRLVQRGVPNALYDFDRLDRAVRTNVKLEDTGPL